MKTLWITYSWNDNKDGDVEFLAQELEKSGISVKLDRWNIQAGKRLWEQIDNFITNNDQSDAWAIVATQNSLGSEPCKEEVAYALDRALNNRGEAFPIIGIFPSDIDLTLIPSSIRTRLFVSLKDTNWIERIKSSLYDRAPNVVRPSLEPYSIDLMTNPSGGYVIQMRPRAGSWAPFVCAVPMSEKDQVKPRIMRGAKGTVPGAGILTNYGEGPSDDGEWWMMSAGDEATPTMSFYLFVNHVPSRIVFGVHNNQPQYLVPISRSLNVAP